MPKRKDKKTLKQQGIASDQTETFLVGEVEVLGGLRIRHRKTENLDEFVFANITLKEESLHLSKFDTVSLARWILEEAGEILPCIPKKKSPSGMPPLEPQSGYLTKILDK